MSGRCIWTNERTGGPQEGQYEAASAAFDADTCIRICEGLPELRHLRVSGTSVYGELSRVQQALPQVTEITCNYDAPMQR